MLHNHYNPFKNNNNKKVLFFYFLVQGVFSAPFAVLFHLQLFFNFFLVLFRPIVDMLAHFALELY